MSEVPLSDQRQPHRGVLPLRNVGSCSGFGVETGVWRLGCELLGVGNSRTEEYFNSAMQARPTQFLHYYFCCILREEFAV